MRTRSWVATGAVAGLLGALVVVVLLGLGARPARAHGWDDEEDLTTAVQCRFPTPHGPPWCRTTTTSTTSTTTSTTTTTTTRPVVPPAGSPGAPVPMPGPVAALDFAPTDAGTRPPASAAVATDVAPDAPGPERRDTPAPVLGPAVARAERVWPGSFPSPVGPGGGTVPLGVAAGLAVAGLVTGVLVGYGALGHPWRRG